MLRIEEIEESCIASEACRLKFRFSKTWDGRAIIKVDWTFTRSVRIRDGRDEGHEAGAAKELGYEDGGMSLRLRTLDPLQAWPKDTGIAASFTENSATIAAHRRSNLPSRTERDGLLKPY
ncbi:hypothetical protein HPP92_026571 [Vanilla planifolia]|uniref:Uncharacterized protein n=1 Tax=Vanilla planifolia TaxID=51239 RepID=A0A835U7B9_VANPL|nr:hypothetical protein HPP92_026571 [Vanilla planifolia]